MAPADPPCRHCQGPGPLPPLGLCATCAGSAAKFAHRGHGIGRRLGLKPPPYPTDALPGTPAKVAVLEGRARLGVCLWHPLDARAVLPAGGEDDYPALAALARAA